MKLCFTELMIGLSYALDYIEGNLIGVQHNHSKRTGYLCALLGSAARLKPEALLDLTCCAVLHDNALSEYVQKEYMDSRFTEGIPRSKLGIHCYIGERNVLDFPFWGNVKGVILYHHENADGSGPFGKKEGDINLYSALIHLADQLDARFHLNSITDKKWDMIQHFLSQNEGILFGTKEIRLFRDNITKKDLENMGDECIEKSLEKLLVYPERDYSPKEIMHISGIFAHIVDYKSTFTCAHSLGLAQKAYTMGDYYGLSEEMKAKLFLSGALHDIGKLAVDTRILEKPERLTDEEFEQVKYHAIATYQILSQVRGMEDICRWASFHHEKLNGCGYPFGHDASVLNKYDRLIGCLDIYQALREDRPYKKGKTHQETMKIMEYMADNNFIDKEITRDLDNVFG